MKKKHHTFLCGTCKKQRPLPAYANSAKGIMECEKCTAYLQK